MSKKGTYTPNVSWNKDDYGDRRKPGVTHEKKNVTRHVWTSEISQR